MTFCKMEQFKDVINGEGLVLVDFFATWCGPCKTMYPVLEDVKKTLGDNIRIVKIDVDRQSSRAAQYGIQSVPTLMLFRGGKQLCRQSGYIPSKELLSAVSRFAK